MAGVCYTCKSSKRDEIEADMVSGMAFLQMEKKYDIDDAALKNHRDNCIPALFKKRQLQADCLHADTLLAKLDFIQARTWEVYNAHAHLIDKPAHAGILLKALARAESQVQTAARIMGAILEKDEVSGSVADTLNAARARLAANREADADETSILETVERVRALSPGSPYRSQ